MKTFKTWEEANAWARMQVKASGVPMYIKVSSTPNNLQWVVGYLPRVENRSGWELTVEAVEV